MGSKFRCAAIVVGTAIAFCGRNFADDDAVRLEGRTKTSLKGGGQTASEFSYADRAKADDEDLEDVHFRYNLGYRRGTNGTPNVLPRFYAFRRGFSDGASGSGYHGGLAGRAGYASAGESQSASYASNSMPQNGSAASYSSGGMANPSGQYSAPSTNLNPPRRVMMNPEPPLASPAAGEYPYDGPTVPRSTTPNNRNGGPPSPLDIPRPAVPSPNGNSSDGRLVKFEPVVKKYSYPAYGDYRVKNRDRDALAATNKD